MTHRAETIMSTVETLLTGLTTTGGRIARDDPRIVESHPAIRLSQGSDNVSPDRTTYPRVGRDLSVRITIHVKTNTAPSTQMNLIREEVFRALTADHTLGLSYVTDITSIGDEEPELTGDADQITGSQEMNFIVKYRHLWDNAGA